MTPWNVSRLIEFKRRIYPEKPPWGELISTKTRAAPGSRPSAWAWPPAQMAEDDFRSVGWTLRTKRYSDAGTVWNHWFSVRRANCYEQLVTQTQSKGTGVKMMTMVRRHGILSFNRFLWYTCRNKGPILGPFLFYIDKGIQIKCHFSPSNSHLQHHQIMNIFYSFVLFFCLAQAIETQRQAFTWTIHPINYLSDWYICNQLLATSHTAHKYKR